MPFAMKSWEIGLTCLIDWALEGRWGLSTQIEAVAPMGSSPSGAPVGDSSDDLV